MTWSQMSLQRTASHIKKSVKHIFKWLWVQFNPRILIFALYSWLFHYPCGKSPHWLWERCLYRYHENISNTPVGVHQSEHSVFWAVMLCCLIDHYHCFRGTYCLHLEAKRCRHQVLLQQYLGPVCWNTLHGIPDNNFIVTAVITLNLTCLNLIYNQPLSDWTVRGFIAQ